MQNNEQYKKLTLEEEQVMINKGTEKPFTGEYWNFFGKGKYVCKRCNAPLYYSEDKFESECGWPSFDDAIPGAVKQIPDADGYRTEIICNNCGAHLGHVFTGEHLTDKNIRYCVNSISMLFIPDAGEAENTIRKVDTAIFAGGCFWGMQYYFEDLKGVVSTDVGYIGGNKANPSYKDVCSHTTGHAEALKVIFEPALLSYEDLAKLFFEIHDPTQLNRQGPDIGDQYRSAVFYLDDSQKKTVEKLINILIKKGYAVVTQLVDARNLTFWIAEDYHRDYYKKTGGEPYCHIYKKKF